MTSTLDPTASPAPSRPKHILVVDDQAFFRHAATLCLSGPDFQVLSVGNGPAALALLRSGSPVIDLAIIGLALPGMDGATLVRTLHRDFPRLPLGLISPPPTPGEARDARAALPVCFHLQKPFPLEVLRLTVVNLLLR